MPEWHAHATNANWIVLGGAANAAVRVKPMPDGRFMWQFRKTVSYAPSVDLAKEYVEAGAEYFAAMRRNPYAS